MAATELVRSGLSDLFQRYRVASLLDAPCGDAVWISTLVEGLEIYLGVDVVADLVAENTRRQLAPNMFFRSGDIVSDALPRVDAILCRDCLVHLPLELAVQAIANFRRSQSMFLIATTFPDAGENLDTAAGGWRRLSLELPPFSLTGPAEIIRERKPNPKDPYNDTSLGVWRLN